MYIYICVYIYIYKAFSPDILAIITINIIAIIIINRIAIIHSWPAACHASLDCPRCCPNPSRGLLAGQLPPGGGGGRGEGSGPQKPYVYILLYIYIYIEREREIYRDI